jgi:hypothetical protein
LSDNYDIPEPSKDPAIRARQQRGFIITAVIVVAGLALVGWVWSSISSAIG